MSEVSREDHNGIGINSAEKSTDPLGTENNPIPIVLIIPPVRTNENAAETKSVIAVPTEDPSGIHEKTGIMLIVEKLSLHYNLWWSEKST